LHAISRAGRATPCALTNTVDRVAAARRARLGFFASVDGQVPPSEVVHEGFAQALGLYMQTEDEHLNFVPKRCHYIRTQSKGAAQSSPRPMHATLDTAAWLQTCISSHHSSASAGSAHDAATTDANAPGAMLLQAELDAEHGPIGVISEELQRLIGTTGVRAHVLLDRLLGYPVKHALNTALIARFSSARLCCPDCSCTGGAFTQQPAAVADPKSVSIHVTGHSLGGALAALFATAWGSSPENMSLRARVHLITFGQPRLGNKGYADRMADVLNSGGARETTR